MPSHDEDDNRSDSSMEEDEVQKPEVAAQPDENGDISLAGGNVIKRILQQGQGADTPPNNAEVSVHYVGTLLDGKEFDSSRKRNEPFKFKLGQRQVIRGWDVGVATMKKGEKALLTIKPEYAYGKNGAGSIPPDATLKFEVELLSWISKEKVTEDGLVIKDVIAKGEGYNRVNDGGKATVRYRTLLDGKVIEDFSKQDVVLHVGDDLTLTAGLEACLKKMLKGEKCVCTVQPSYGYGDAGNPKLGVPPKAVLTYEVELKSFEKGKERWDMEMAEKIEFCKKRKDQGNEYYKQGQLKRAEDKYQITLDFFGYEANDLTDEQKSQIHALKALAYSNLAAVDMKRNDWEKVKRHCTEALKLEPTNVKVLYRRAQAFTHLHDDDAANTDLKKALDTDPKNTPCQELYRVVSGRLRQQEAKARKAFSGFFNKVDLVDEEETKRAYAKAKKIADENLSDDDDEDGKKMETDTTTTAAKTEAQPAAMEVDKTTTTTA